MREKKIYKVTFIGSIVNFVLLIFKFIAGILGNSAAMTADAVHSLSDFISDIIVVFFINISSKPEDKNHDYGHGKYETLATVFIGVILLLVSMGVGISSIKTIIDFINGEAIIKPEKIAIIAAIVSIFSKEILFQYSIRVGKKINSQVVIANAWHHRSDALSSLGTTIGIGGAYFLGNNWVILDPIAAIVVSILILKVAISLIVPSLEDLLEKSLSDEIENKILATVLRVPEIFDPHDLRTRRIGSYYAIELHVRMYGNISLKAVDEKVKQIEKELKDQFGPRTHIAIHVEPL